MRVVTHNDFDGVVSAMLVSVCEHVDDYLLVQRVEDMSEGKIKVTPDDIICDLPRSGRCAMWFDHHIINLPIKGYNGSFELAPSAARVIFNYYSKDPISREKIAKYEKLVAATDIVDSAAYTSPEDILNPKGAILLGFTMSRDTEYSRKLIGWLRDADVDDILRYEEVAERVKDVRKQVIRGREILAEKTKTVGNMSIADFIGTHTGNYKLLRHVQCALFKEPLAVLLHKVKYPDGERLRADVGINKLAKGYRLDTDIGSLAKQRYNGGGHATFGVFFFKDENELEDWKANVLPMIASKVR